MDMSKIKFDEKGLVPAIAQDAKTGQVLMLAYMNAESLQMTLDSGYATYFSRSRQQLWRKGETSGHTQRVLEMRYDCDGDALLLTVEQEGPACHTGEISCFHNPILTADADDLPPTADVVQQVYDAAALEHAEALTICAQLEEEISALEPDEKAAFLEEMGVQESGLDQLVRACYRLLGLISFLTAGADEVRAWTIRRGWKAPQAAGVIHTDFERGFIRAEIVPFTTLMELGSMSACKEKGLVRSEGKEYVMQDGDVTLFRFNV